MKRTHEGCSHNKCGHIIVLSTKPKKLSCPFFTNFGEMIPFPVGKHLCEHFFRKKDLKNKP